MLNVPPRLFNIFDQQMQFQTNTYSWSSSLAIFIANLNRRVRYINPLNIVISESGDQYSVVNVSNQALWATPFRERSSLTNGGASATEEVHVPVD
jgi:hypothetical protein